MLNSKLIGFAVVVHGAFPLETLVANAGKTPSNCNPTAVGTPDDCQAFAPKGNKTTTECQVALKGAPDYLKICTFTNGLEKGKHLTGRPCPKNCKPVKCDHPCYIPCVYFIARNRSFKDTGSKEFKLVDYKTYACHGESDSMICGCASVAQ